MLGSVDHMKQEDQFSFFHVECGVFCTSLHRFSDDCFWEILTRSLVLYRLHTSHGTS
uniref:Uncharacterized protein n=1 Tax=Arundo donax TaxID=35708 RepID=A0A0A9DL84_ARUDO